MARSAERAVADVRVQKWEDREHAFNGMRVARLLGEKRAMEGGYANAFRPATTHFPVTQAQYELLERAGLGLRNEALMEAYSSDEECDPDSESMMEEKHADAPAIASAAAPAHRYRVPKRLMWRSELADTALHNLDRFAYRAVLKPGERRYRLGLPEEAVIRARQVQDPERFESRQRMPRERTMIAAFMTTSPQQLAV